MLNELNVSITSQFVSKFTEYEFICDLLNISLYPIDPTITIATTVDIDNFIKTFLKNINKDITNIKLSTQTSPVVLRKQFNVIKIVLDIKQDMNVRQVTYDNIQHHFQNRDIHVEKLIKHVISNKISSTKEYREKFSAVIQTIQSYNLLREMRESFVDIDSLFQDFNNSEIPITHHINKFKEIIFNTHNKIATLNVIERNNKLSDYLILDGDSDNLKNVSELVTQFLQTGYSFYKTNYSLLDTNIGGLESSSVTIISGPSNHAKSIFMLNLLRNIAEHNDFQDNDCIVLVTLEDDIYKLLRRVMSIFGNFETTAVKQLFVKSSTYLQQMSHLEATDPNNVRTQKISQLIYDLLQTAIRDITGNNVALSLIHSNENSFSTSDLSKRIDKLIVEGYRVKLVAVDYIDVMSPSTGGYSAIGDDYNVHGAILHELRVLSRLYRVPILTITQNVRSSENPQIALSNNLVGDSIKKIRYADYIYMIRTRYDLDIFSDQVKEDTNDIDIDDGTVNPFAAVADTDVQKLYPFEVKITKAKEGERDKVKFHLFSGHNLRIYDSLSNFYQDLPKVKKSKQHINAQLDLIMSESFVDFNDLDLDYENLL